MSMGKTTNKADAKTAVSATPPMTKEQEVIFRERATNIDDRVAGMMRAMFATIDAARAAVADRDKKLESVAKERDAALAVIEVAVPGCSWAECKDKATRAEVGDDVGPTGPTGRVCDAHDHGRPVADSGWAVALRALLLTQGRKPATGRAEGRP